MKPYVRAVGAILGLIRAEFRQLRNRYFGKIERFHGTPQEICAQIIDRLWEGDFYRTSLGHFDFFWMRDFGTVAESLTNLGHQKKVHHTISWIMRHYRRAGIVKQCVDKAGNVFNAPARHSVDALPWLLHTIVASDYILNKSQRVFIEKQLKGYIKRFLDPKSGMLKKAHYAEMRDAVYYDRSAYSIALIGRMAHCVEALQLQQFPFPAHLYEEVLVKEYWNGRFFNADKATKVFSAESALMPFFLKVVNDADKVDATMDFINEQKLNLPYPLQYGQKDEIFNHRLGMGKWAMPNYTGTTIWSWHATFYLHVLKRYGRPEYKQQYEKFSELIARHQTYPELTNPDGSWYNVPIYKADPGMVWAALFLELEAA